MQARRTRRCYLLKAESWGLVGQNWALPASDTASLLSDSPQQEQREPADAAQALDAVELKSAAQQDYSVLKEHLSKGAFQKADDETRAKLIQLAGKEASKRNWVYFSEVQFIPSEDLQTIDQLWKAGSGGVFGFSVQRELWMQNRKYWTRFFKAISWVTGERNNYRKWPGEFMYTREAPKGHLPLTNCLRGTQLFEAILQHPAFVKESSNPDWMA
ncbi:hypothetical protein WJX73_010690 [Symbiochloris irregularis]|uniref:GUN4-like domain-containing protein n=1 Tax=Symbiochloris irregularis TaxID=706552 RepID=A0AAW1PW38_9CHLO